MSNNKFYQLAASEILKLSDLSPAERQLYLYLHSLDPFCDGLEIAVREVAHALGYARETISRALSKLEKGGWLPMKIVRRCIYRCFSPMHSQSHKQDSNESPSAQSQKTSKPTSRKQKWKKAKISKTRELQESSPSELEQFNQKLEENFVDQSEVETFLAFCKRKMDGLQYPVQLPKKWILSNWDFLYSEFREAYPKAEDKSTVVNEQQHNSKIPFKKGNINQGSVTTNGSKQSQQQYRPAKEVSCNSPEYFQIVRQRIDNLYNIDCNNYPPAESPLGNDSSLDDCGIDDADNNIHPADRYLSAEQRRWLRSLGCNI